MNQSTAPAADHIAYILKAYARTSETFITNEIYRLEQLGLKLKIFSFLRLEGQQQHAAVDAIKAEVEYLPPLTSFTEKPLLRWLRQNRASFWPAHQRLLKKQPARYLLALLEALRFSLIYRDKQFIKEFLQAGYIAERILAAGNIRHLHAHFAHTSTTVTMFASRLSNLPFSFTGHAKDIYLRTLNPGNLLAHKLARARFVVTCTQANEAHLLSINPHSAPIHTIYHGLDTAQFAPLEKAAESTRPIILAVGRFVEKKGYRYLVEACRRLKEQGYDFECHLVGGGDASSIKALIEQLQLSETVIIHSAVTQEELRRIYQRATLFALPCQIIDNGDRDGIPNVLAEAMAMELPVVSTNISGIPELVSDHEDGLLVPPKDAAALAAAIAELLDDPALRLRLGKAAREKVCRIFDVQVNVQKLYRLFQ